MALYNSLIPCIALFTLPVGAWFVLKGWSKLPDLALVLCMSFGIGAPLLRALSFLPTMPQVNYKIEAVEQLMCAPPLMQAEKPFTGKDHSVSFEDVRFDYVKNSGAAATSGAAAVGKTEEVKKPEEMKKPKEVKKPEEVQKRDTEVLHGVTFSAKEGSLTALVGESGSGKSTLAKLLVHFYDVTGGAVKIGGQDVRDMSIEALNQKISYVSQEQFLFNMSLMDNMNWYDGIVIDKVWVGHSKFWVLPGTKDIPFVQTWGQVLKKRCVLTLIWVAGAAVTAGLVVLFF